MKAALPGSLAGADRVHCYAANLGWDASAALAPLGAKADVHDRLDALVDAIAAEARAGDHVLGDEQRRLRRHPRQAAAHGSAHVHERPGRPKARIAPPRGAAPPRGENSSVSRSVESSDPRSSICTASTRRRRPRRGASSRARQPGSRTRRSSICRAFPTGRRWRSARSARGSTPWRATEATSRSSAARSAAITRRGLPERYGARAVLINPAIRPYDDLRPYLGRQRNLHTGEEYDVTPEHFAELAALKVTRITRPQRLLPARAHRRRGARLARRGGVLRGCVRYVAGGRRYHGWTNFGDELASVLRFAEWRMSPKGPAPRANTGVRSTKVMPCARARPTRSRSSAAGSSVPRSRSACARWGRGSRCSTKGTSPIAPRAATSAWSGCREGAWTCPPTRRGRPALRAGVATARRRAAARGGDRRRARAAGGIHVCVEPGELAQRVAGARRAAKQPDSGATMSRFSKAGSSATASRHRAGRRPGRPYCRSMATAIR